MADEEFSPEAHRFAEPRYFDDLGVGERFYIPSRTVTEALFAAFQLASGDNHPIHYDRPYCRARGHRDLLAHGLLVAAQARRAPASSRTWSAMRSSPSSSSPRASSNPCTQGIRSTPCS